MAGTLKGGKKAAATNRRKYGLNFYKEIGSQGGSTSYGNTSTKGFASDRVRASEAGRKGGTISKRRPTKVKNAT